MKKNLNFIIRIRDHFKKGMKQEGIAGVVMYVNHKSPFLTLCLVEGKIDISPLPSQLSLLVLWLFKAIPNSNHKF